MRTNKEIAAHIRKILASMMDRPKMYAATASGLEEQFLMLCAIYEFAVGNDEERTLDKWRKLVHEDLGYSGSMSVASWLMANNRITEDDWSRMMELMKAYMMEEVEPYMALEIK